MDSLNQTALMKLGNHEVVNYVLNQTALMNEVAYYSNTILGFFELAASVTRKYIVAKNLNHIFQEYLI